jgi:hypothetical protein
MTGGSASAQCRQGFRRMSLENRWRRNEAEPRDSAFPGRAWERDLFCFSGQKIEALADLLGQFAV